MRPNKTFDIYDGRDNCTVRLNAFDNGDGVAFHNLEVTIHTMDGDSSTMTIELDGDFDPDEIGKKLIAARMNRLS